MATRAYKIAEELGIERGEFVEKARAAGIELKNAMASLDEDQIAMLREKLTPKKGVVTEARVERKSGTVIRRRKRAAPPPEPEPIQTEPVVEPETSGVAAEAEAPVDSDVTPEVTPEPEPVVPAPPEPAQPVPARAASDAPARGQKAAAASGAEAPPDKRGQKKKQFREVVNLREQEQIARQVTSRTTGRTSQVDARAFQSPRRKRRDALSRPAAKVAAPKDQRRIARVEGEISVGELAKQIGAKAAEVQGKLMGLGTMVSINQRIDVETAKKVAEGYGYEVQDVGFQEEQYIAQASEEGSTELVPRPPVVTVMGHVDHGKTSLLDALREANVVAGEAGGITQHIGAYQVDVNGHLVTFIDTPGHAAFTAMRARGAEVTDLVILVIAASEGIMPQTVEAIDHARAAGVPMVVAVNKCDLPDANPQGARQRLTEHNVVVEDFGGEVLAVDISALKRTGLDKLLEAVVLQAELLEPKADPNRKARGVVLESRLDKGRGPVATILVQEGTLRGGDIIVVGKNLGRVRSMTNERGDTLKEAPPSTPVEVIGLDGVPEAGDPLDVVENERAAKEIVAHRAERSREKTPTRPRVSLEDLFARAEGGGPQELNVIIKADMQGSAEALRESLEKLPSDKVTLKVLATGVGGVSESDVQLAQASSAIVIGFHVRPDSKARRLAESVGVDMRMYSIIYEAIDEVRAAMAGLLPPTLREKVIGQAEVRETFNIPKVGTIAGCYVTEGLMRRNAGCRLVRDGVLIHEGKFGSLKRFKDDVREVQTNFECGIGIENYNDLKVGDLIEAYEYDEVPAVL